MYAVIRVAGFQYRVEKGQTVKVPRLEAEEGASLSLGEVLLLKSGTSVTVGRPHIDGASVSVEVVGHGRTAKTVAGKFKRRRKYRRRWGYRAEFTEIRIADILTGA